MRRCILAAALVVVGGALGGCSVPVADLPLVGLPAGAPVRPTDAAVYPAVHDMPVARTEPMLDPTDQAKIEKDLIRARDQQAAATGHPVKAAEKSQSKSQDKSQDKNQDKPVSQ